MCALPTTIYWSPSRLQNVTSFGNGALTSALMLKWSHQGWPSSDKVLPWWLSFKELTCNVGDPSLIPGLGKSPGEGNGYWLQSSCLENPMDRGAWRATVHGVAKSQTRLSKWHFRPTWMESLREKKRKKMREGDVDTESDRHRGKGMWIKEENVICKARSLCDNKKLNCGKQYVTLFLIILMGCQRYQLQTSRLQKCKAVNVCWLRKQGFGNFLWQINTGPIEKWTQTRRINYK